MLRLFGLPISLLVLTVSTALGQSGANVLLVANGNSADSVRIAEAYAKARRVPQDQVLRVSVDPAADEVTRDTYDRQIQAPIADWLGRSSAQDRILYVVLTKGMPLRIKGTTGREGTVSSVDSELAMLYRRLAGGSAVVPGALPNPYYLADAAIAQARPFTHADYDVYLVTRLDGFTPGDALALIDRASRASRDGRIVLDEKAGLSDAGGDQWLRAAADWLIAHGFGERVVHDQTTRVIRTERDVLGYYSWGSNDPAVSTRHTDLGFLPGALAGMFLSTDARTFREPPVDWKIASWADRSKFFAGSPQSLLGDLIRDGVTGVSGYVAEPYLDAAVRPNILFPAYLSGFNLAESFYLAMPSLSWQAVVVGDPLCAPFPRKTLQASDIDKGIDPVTELPAFFSARSAQAMMSGGTRPDAVKAMLRSQSRSARGDKAGAQKALEEATSADARLDTAHILLAAAYEEQKQYDKAIERYRQVLANTPGNAVALNNLAYALAIYKRQPAEALAYAERAHTISPVPVIADTLGWVLHLLGRDKEAAQLLPEAARKLPEDAEVRMHAAVVFGALGMLDAAASELNDALRLDPALATRAEIVALRAKLKQPRK